MDRLLEFNYHTRCCKALAAAQQQSNAVAFELYGLFDAQRKHQDAVKADWEDLWLLGEAEKEMKGRSGD